MAVLDQVCADRTTLTAPHSGMTERRQRALAPFLDSLAVDHRHEPRDDEHFSDGGHRQMSVTRKQQKEQRNYARSDP